MRFAHRLSSLLAGTIVLCSAAGAAAADLHAQLVQRVHADVFTLQAIEPVLAGPPLVFVADLDGVPHEIELSPHSLRGDAFQVVIDGAHGPESVEPPAPATLRGTARPMGAADAIGSVVAGSFDEDGLDALIRLPDGRLFAIQPVKELVPEAEIDDAIHVVYAAADVHGFPGECGNHQLTEQAGNGGSSAQGAQGNGPATAAATAAKRTEIAFDADHEYYLGNGSSVAATVLDVENVLNQVDAIYDAEVGIRYELTHVRVRTAVSDPYTSADASALLVEFRDHWNANETAVKRDVAHLMTGRAVNGSVIGIAYVGVVCSSTFAYGLSESKFSGNLVQRTSLTAHELGHNWNASHCNGQADCAIMCSFVGGCNGLSTFGVQDENTINAWKQASLCLDSAPDVLTAPFGETFTSATLDAARWSWIHGATVNSNAQNVPTGTLALNLDAAGAQPGQDDEIRTAPIDLSGPGPVAYSLHVQHSGVENGEALVVEYLNSSLLWLELARVTSDGVDQTAFAAVAGALPADALHGAFRLRLRAEVDEANDEWYVDDVMIGSDQAPPIVHSITLTPDPFESGEPLAVDVSVADLGTGVAAVDAALMDGMTVVAQTSLTAAGTTWSGTLTQTGGLAEGSYSVAVTATDAASNSVTQAQPVGAFDRPVLANATFTPDPPTDIDELDVEVAATDSVMVALVTATRVVNGGPQQTIVLGYDSLTSTWKGTFDAPLASGPFTLTFNALDDAGHAAESLVVNGDVDASGNLPPFVTLTSASGFELGAPFTVTANAVDLDSSLDSVVAELRDGPTVVASAPMSPTLPDGSWIVQLDTTGLLEQEYTLAVAAQDTEAHVTEAADTVLAYDVPVLTNLAVDPAAPHAGEAFSVAVDVADSSPLQDVTVTLFLGTQSLGSTELTEDSGTWSEEFAAAGTAGTLYVSVVARDALGITSPPALLQVPIAVEPMALANVTPAFGPVAGGTAITVEGSGLASDVEAGTLRVLVGGVQATHVKLLSNSKVTAVTPAGAAGAAMVEVRAKKAGQVLSATLTPGFAFHEAPKLLAVTPDSGPVLAASTLVLSGSGFDVGVASGSTTVTVGDREAESVDVLDDGTVVAVLPAGGAPDVLVDVVLTNSNGSTKLKKAFRTTAAHLVERGSIAVDAPVDAMTRAARSGAYAAQIALGSGDDDGVIALVDAETLAVEETLEGAFLDGGFGTALVGVESGGLQDALELFVGSPRFDDDPAMTLFQPGAYFDLRGGDPLAAPMTMGSTAFSEFGAALALALDQDGDGLAELIAVGEPATGFVHLVDVATYANALDFAGDAAGRFGAVLASNAEAAGTTLVLMGAPDDANGAGRALLFRIGAGPVSAHLLTLEGAAAGDASGPHGSGLALLVPGDLDDDGHADVVLGFPGAQNGRGRVAAFSGATGVLLWERHGLLEGDAFGAALAACADVDEDGATDLLVGAPGEDGAAADAGAVRLLSGAAGATLTAFPGDEADLRLGRRVAVLEDLDGDLSPELLAATADPGTGARVVVLRLDPRSYTARGAAGDRLKARLDSPQDRDGLSFEVSEDELLELRIVGATAAEPVRAVLFDDEGTVLLDSDPDADAFDPDYVVQESGELRLLVESFEYMAVHLLVASEDALPRTVTVRSKRLSAGAVAIEDFDSLSGDGDDLEFTFPGLARARLSGTVRGPKGAKLKATDLVEEDGFSFHQSKPNALPKGKSRTVRLAGDKVKLPELGEYTLQIHADEGPEGDVDVKLKLTLPKSKKTFQQ